jgi:octaheme c-type cytochrome (tetrathionate reductase family)
MRIVVLLASVGLLAAASAAAQVPDVPPPAPVPESTADHGKFEELEGPFADGPEVTRACLACHTEAGTQFEHSIHWTWAFEHPDTGQTLGKKTVINSFCGSLRPNEPRCTSCHAGYGWEDADFDFTDQARMDCLVCHDQTGTYKKFPTGAGHPVYEAPKTFNGKVWEPVDLAHVARHVGAPRRENCGVCHFFGGGGDNVKHGDLSSVLEAPAPAVDVHMSPEGENFACTECHVGSAHQWAGSRYDVTAVDPAGTGLPGERRDVATCESCHGTSPHPLTDYTNLKLNDHVDRVACQSCHIPAFARGGVATKTWWDWSAAGRMRDGEPFKVTDEAGHEVYNTMKGAFRWEADAVPEYAWFDGQMTYTLVDDTLDPAGVVPINRFGGSADDPGARIWPFKVMRGKQPYDSAQNHLVYNQLFAPGSTTAFWGNFDMAESIPVAMAAAGEPYSGEFDYVETTMHWPVTHMVAPAADAVGCIECHRSDGRMADIAGVYIPGRDHNPLVHTVGTVAFIACLGLAVLHGALRFYFSKRRSREG